MLAPGKPVMPFFKTFLKIPFLLYILAVHDKDYFYNNFIASVVVPTEDLDRLLVVEGWFYLQRWKFDCGEIHFRVEYIPVIATALQQDPCIQ